MTPATACSGFGSDSIRTLHSDAKPALSGLTEVELTWIENRLEHCIRFGRIAAERAVGARTRIISFRPGATFAFMRRTASDIGTLDARIAIIAAALPGQPYAMHPLVRPGGEILLEVGGLQVVRQVLAAIDAVEAADIDPCDVSPDHWRQVGAAAAAGLPPRPYGRDRHAAWLRRRASAS